MRLIKEVIECVERETVPKVCLSSTSRVEKTYKNFLNYLSENLNSSVYGANTFPGHRDSEKVPDEYVENFQRYLLSNHAINVSDFHPPRATKYVTLSKLLQIAAGGATVSGPIYQELLEIAPTFEDTCIPKNASYSSGDVIPASHWSLSALQKISQKNGHVRLRAGEAMGLINGTFVHNGLAIFLLVQLKRTWAWMVESMRADVAITQMPNSNLAYWHTAEFAEVADVIRYIGECAAPTERQTQLPVSYRAIPQEVEALHGAIKSYALNINANLLRPSGNPLFLEQNLIPSAPSFPHSQGSFLNPSLSISTTALIEAVLFSLWAHVERTKYLLSGNVNGIAIDGASKDDPIEFIQWPKLMQAELESIRLDLSRTVFSSGSSTSHGIEDLWTFGVMNCERLLSCLPKINHLIARGVFIRGKLGKRKVGSLNFFTQEVHDAVINSENSMQTVRQIVEHSAEPAGRRFYPI